MIPVDADKRLSEVRRALKKLANHRETPKLREELFSNSSFPERWQQEILSKLTKANIIENEAGPGKPGEYKFPDGVSISQYFDMEVLSAIIWPQGEGLAGTSGSQPMLEDLDDEELDEEPSVPPDGPYRTPAPKPEEPDEAHPAEPNELEVLANMAQLVANLIEGQSILLSAAKDFNSDLEITKTAVHYAAATQKEVIERLKRIEDRLMALEKKNGQPGESGRGVHDTGEGSHGETEGGPGV